MVPAKPQWLPSWKMVRVQLDIEGGGGERSKQPREGGGRGEGRGEGDLIYYGYLGFLATHILKSLTGVWRAGGGVLEDKRYP